MNLYEVAEDAYLARAGSVSTNGIGAAVDAVEPLIRGDEGKRNAIAEVERAWAERADLRAKVEALPIWEDSQGWLVMSYKDVVALLGRGSDD